MNFQKVNIRRIFPLAGLLVLLEGCDQGVETYDFPSNAMEPTIAAGSVVTVDKMAYGSKPPERFDIVVVTPPDADHGDYIGRVVGLPTEEALLDNLGLRINGKLLEHPEGLEYRPADTGRFKKVRLAAEQYFILGDHIENARDGRYFGPVSRNAIKGKVTSADN